MTGKEVKLLYIDQSEQNGAEISKAQASSMRIDFHEKKIELKVEMSQGDIITMTFNSPRKSIYLSLAVRLWSNGDLTYQNTSQGLAINPALYWNIHKREECGKDFLLGTGYKMKINEQECMFVPTSYYFQNQKPVVYGIYLKDELLYIGSSSNYEQRWKEHYLEFAAKDKNPKINQMYHQGIDPDELEFKILFDEQAMNSIQNFKYINMYLYEIAECVYIKKLDPKYNVEGKTKSFKPSTSCPYSITPKELELFEQKVEEYLIKSISENS